MSVPIFVATCVFVFSVQLHYSVDIVPERGHLFPDQGSYEYDQIRVSLCIIVFNCLGLLSCIELCIFCVVWFCLLVR